MKGLLKSLHGYTYLPDSDLIATPGALLFGREVAHASLPALHSPAVYMVIYTAGSVLLLYKPDTHNTKRAGGPESLARCVEPNRTPWCSGDWHYYMRW